MFKRLTHWCEKYDGIWVNEQTGSKKREVLSEAVSSTRAASTEHAQTGCAPAPLFHTEELAERAEHTHRDTQLHTCTVLEGHVQVLSRAVQAGYRNDLTLGSTLMQNDVHWLHGQNLHWCKEDCFLHWRTCARESEGELFNVRVSGWLKGSFIRYDDDDFSRARLTTSCQWTRTQ